MGRCLLMTGHDGVEGEDWGFGGMYRGLIGWGT